VWKSIRLHRVRFPILALLLVLLWLGWGLYEPRSDKEAWINRAGFAVSIAVLMLGGTTTKPR